MSEALAFALVGPPFVAGVCALSAALGGEWVAFLFFVATVLYYAAEWRHAQDIASHNPHA